ncbi:MAG: 50S ribosomal protein L29 [archaeon]|nr:50S ribosomal protein L29 [Candidatus Bathyarchaeum sp.]
MAILRVKEIREMSSEQRLEKVNEFRTELARIKTMVAAGGAIDNPSQIKEMRKTIARILTIEAEVQQSGEQK